jgi:2-polyprenyl-3-methyl-5-hydroxy-6-metoxy-1,4-benzoquinol methylase
MRPFQRKYRMLLIFIVLLVVVKKLASDPPCSPPDRMQVRELHGKSKTFHDITSEHLHLEAFFKESLATLSRNKAQLSNNHSLRALLIREKVGLKWNMFPERYWETQVLPKLSKQITVLDVGANEGQFAIPMAERGHHVISLEPKESTCASLKESLRSKGLQKQVRHFLPFVVEESFIVLRKNRVRIVVR